MGRIASLAKRASDWIGHLSNVQWAWGLIVISIPSILAFIRHEPAWYVAALAILMTIAAAVLFFAWDIWRRGGRQGDLGLQPPKPVDVTTAAPKAKPSQKHPSPPRSGLFGGFSNPIPDSAFKDLAKRLEQEIEVLKATQSVASNTSASLGLVVTRASAFDVSLTEAALYAVTGKWGLIGGKEHFATNKERVLIGNQVADWLAEFEQKASDGAVRVWGKPQENSSGPLVEIDALHWRTHEAYAISVALGEPKSRQRISMSREGGYDDLRVNRAEFEREWPHA